MENRVGIFFPFQGFVTFSFGLGMRNARDGVFSTCSGSGRVKRYVTHFDCDVFFSLTCASVVIVFFFL